MVDIVFDYDVISRRQATAAYKRIINKWPNDITSRFLYKEPHWEDDKDFVPLQAAVLKALQDIDTGIAVIEEKQLSIHVTARKNTYRVSRFSR